jgi:S-adenosylhomocysteine hydrolase
MKSASGKILVIEDGGYLVPFLHNNYSAEENPCIGAVEQTTKGIRKDESLEAEFKKKSKELYFPVINVAKSNFKDQYESPLVGRSAVHCIQQILSDMHFSGKKALVVGFGAVGREVANSLANQLRMIVSVYDADLDKIAAAKVRGYEASQNLPALTKGATIIIGTTGKTSIAKDILENLTDGSILASASSDQIEIDIPYLNIIAKESIYKPGIGTLYKRHKELSDDTYLLLADGYPINFYFGAGIPTRSIDPVLAQLLIGAIHLASEHQRLNKGISSIMNDLITQYSLLEDFVNTYHD